MKMQSNQIYTPEQMDFTTKKLMPLNGKVLWQTYANGNYRWKAWWGGATVTTAYSELRVGINN